VDPGNQEVTGGDAVLKELRLKRAGNLPRPRTSEPSLKKEIYGSPDCLHLPRLGQNFNLTPKRKMPKRNRKAVIFKETNPASPTSGPAAAKLLEAGQGRGERLAVLGPTASKEGEEQRGGGKNPT